eukprot:CAMPEP_0172683090 /NCGR_PEP_ID=MMETSP1074-20121228/18618_1 /TAXON_ID=2916 /ORGANISM="Ceratium fusus, Strain PA161109" /LENGTH=111 /DNA_ID=CAMNT_0013501887 /DNA_START=57 /DNA_END=390 /DNA_ORIENTATION=+
MDHCADQDTEALKGLEGASSSEYSCEFRKPQQSDKGDIPNTAAKGVKTKTSSDVKTTIVKSKMLSGDTKKCCLCTKSCITRSSKKITVNEYSQASKTVDAWGQPSAAAAAA